MMPVHDKSTSSAGYLCWGRLRCFVKTPFSGIALQLFRGLVLANGFVFSRDRVPLSSCGGEGVVSFRGLARFPFRVDYGRISRDGFPGISVFGHALRHGAEVEHFWCFDRGQFFPLERRGGRGARKSAHAVSRHDRLRLSVAVYIQQNLSFAMFFL